ncbi:MAG: hypothetical protein Q9163_003974 [Psora crenata]
MAATQTDRSLHLENEGVGRPSGGLTVRQANGNAAIQPFPAIRTGLALLFVNKRISRIAFRLFYTRNLFYVPPGPAVPSMAYFNGLSAENRSAIRHVALRVGSCDLTPAVLKKIDEKVASLLANTPEAMTVTQRSIGARTFGVVAASYVSDIWKSKIVALQTFGGITTLSIEFDKTRQVISVHSNLQQRLRGIDSPGHTYEACDGEIGKLLKYAHQDVRKRIQWDVWTEGWPETRESLADLNDLSRMKMRCGRPIAAALRRSWAG